jgi:hypothetical protein
MPFLSQSFRKTIAARPKARRAIGTLAARSASLAHEPGPQNLSSLKLRAIDVACGRIGALTLADLGAVWAVDAGYSFYAADRYGLERAVVVDENFTPAVQARTQQNGAVQLIRGNFSDPSVRERIGRVEAVLMFDILLHQVNPDWDELLDLYARHADTIVIAGPHYLGDKTVRLIDLGRTEYLSKVPQLPLHDQLFDQLDEINPNRGRPWRDVHDVWQWGIVDADLRHVMRELGYSLVYHENIGAWQGLAAFVDCSYVFTREEGHNDGQLTVTEHSANR